MLVNRNTQGGWEKNDLNNIFGKRLAALNTLLLGCSVVGCPHKTAAGWGLVQPHAWFLLRLLLGRSEAFAM